MPSPGGQGGSAPRASTVIGSVTSGAPSPTLGVPIAMAYLLADVDFTDAELSVGIRGAAVPAHLTDLPFYSRRQ
jgi:aminomethyltransferase